MKHFPVCNYLACEEFSWKKYNNSARLKTEQGHGKMLNGQPMLWNMEST